LLVQLEKTTWDGVTVKVNGEVEEGATVNYTKDPSFDAPASVAYSGVVPLGPGIHSVCLETMSSTSGVLDVTESCRTVVVEALEVSPTSQLVDEGADAQFTVRFGGRKAGCDPLAGKTITVESCDGSAEITELKTGEDGSVIVTVPAVAGVTETCYKVCHTASFGSKSCTETVVEYTVSDEQSEQESDANFPPF
jgi:hypothetical protein